MEPPSLPPTPFLQIERAVAPIAFPDPALEHVLRQRLFPGDNGAACMRQQGVRYVYNRMDLDGDRNPETLVALLGRQICGTTGCPLLLLKDLGQAITPLQTIWGFQSALVVGERRNQGWLDLILPQAKGEGGRALLVSHDGTRYPVLPEPSGTEGLSRPTRGVAALVIQERSALVQGHPLGCRLAEQGV